MKSFLRFLFLVFPFSFSLTAVEPLISSLLPRGGKIDSTQEVLVRGKRLDQAAEFFFYSEGISVSKIVSNKPTAVKATFNISKEAALGQHKLRIRTTEGLSNLYTFWVGPYANVKELEPNSGFEQAQQIPINSTVNGVTLSEDVDFYEINATKGQRISVEVEAIRLSGPLFDPYIAVLDDKRFEIATSDDSELLLQDSTLSVIAPRDGIYRVEVRDSSYRGASNFHYRLHVGNFARPLTVFPAGGEAGKTHEFTFLGDAKGSFKAKVTLPATDSPDEFPYHHREGALASPSPNRLRVSPFPSVREAEPNQSRSVATATELFLPLAFDGIIQEDGDIDYFRFHAKKGQRYYIKALARAVASPLDPVLNLYDADGKSLVGNDDSSNGPDSLLTYTFPKTAEYLLRIRDHLGKGSPRHVYRIETHRLAPQVTASIPMFRNRDTQTRQMLPIARGNQVATVLNISRKNFRGDLDFLAKNLPPGVTMEAPSVNENFTSASILLRAAEDAPLVQSLVDLRLHHENLEKKLKVDGSFSHEVALVYGPPNNRSYYNTKVDKLAIAVVEKVPFKIKLHPPATPIVRGGSMNLKVEVLRDANFTDALTIRILSKPPGIGAKGSISIAANKNTGYYSLTANSSTPIGLWKIGVQGESGSSTNGFARAASDFIDLNVEEPYVTLKINMAAVQRGQKGEMVCDLNVMRPFEGTATAELKGLPPFCATPKIEFDSNTSSVSFPITTEEKARAGLTKNLFCFVKIPFSGSLITHTVGQGGQIRLDNPPPKPKAKPKTVAQTKTTAPKAKPVKAKPLSRLEQLRLAAKGSSN
jgi:hypothetical protein